MHVKVSFILKFGGLLIAQCGNIRLEKKKIKYWKIKHSKFGK